MIGRGSRTPRIRYKNESRFGHLTDTRGARAAWGIALVLTVSVLGAVALTRLPDVTTVRLPGAAGGSDTYAVDVEFSDVLDLVPNSTVRLADVPVGRVTAIEVAPGGPTGHVAVAHLQIDQRYDLPTSTRATIRSTSLLGEKYVALTAPAGGTGSLEGAGKISLSATTQDVEVEQILASIGAVLNGGGLQQLATITQEFSAALGGHEQDTRDLLGNLDAILGQLDDGKEALVVALDSAQRLSSVLADQRRVIGDAVVALDPATGVLARQQRQLTAALRSLETLDSKARSIIRRSTRATVSDLESLVPVTRELGKVAKLIPENLTLLVTYPFADNSVPSFSGAYGAVMGGVVVDLPQLLQAIAPTDQPVPVNPMIPDLPTPDVSTRGDDRSSGPRGTSPGLPDVPGLPLPELTAPGGLATLLQPLLGGRRGGS